MEHITKANSESANAALHLVSELQSLFVKGLESVAAKQSEAIEFQPVEWQRDQGQHGGGTRYGSGENAVFNRASVNVSQVHYDDEPEKKLGSATAISTIIHPQNPQGPSMHMHISWTEMKGGQGYWRLMADLNPSLKQTGGKEKFEEYLRFVTQDLYEEGAAQGDKYFNIPALGRHRGVSHYYLEQFKTENADADLDFAKRFGQTVLNGYCEILAKELHHAESPTEAQREEQIAYHTLYLFQVLTLDRGTTSGLMVHDQNDTGIMGSIPARVNRELLASWAEKCESPQDQLVENLVAALPEGKVVEVDDAVKLSLAQAVRAHYKAHPEALSMQASGNVIPPTVSNHSDSMK